MLSRKKFDVDSVEDTSNGIHTHTLTNLILVITFADKYFYYFS